MRHSVHAKVKNQLHTVFEGHPSWDLGGGFFCVAIKSGSSELPHVDFNDSTYLMSWVVPLGRSEGSELILPQFNQKISIEHGEVFGFFSRRLLHFSAPPTSGRRLVLTCFTDKILAKKGLV
jgi:hypothetical protein